MPAERVWNLHRWIRQWTIGNKIHEGFLCRRKMRRFGIRFFMYSSCFVLAALHIGLRISISPHLDDIRIHRLPFFLAAGFVRTVHTSSLEGILVRHFVARNDSLLRVFFIPERINSAFPMGKFKRVFQASFIFLFYLIWSVCLVILLDPIPTPPEV